MEIVFYNVQAGVSTEKIYTKAGNPKYISLPIETLNQATWNVAEIVVGILSIAKMDVSMKAYTTSLF